jgi:hypothetical protein
MRGAMVRSTTEPGRRCKKYSIHYKLGNRTAKPAPANMGAGNFYTHACNKWIECVTPAVSLRGRGAISIVEKVSALPPAG